MGYKPSSVSRGWVGGGDVGQLKVTLLLGLLTVFIFKWFLPFTQINVISALHYVHLCAPWVWGSCSGAGLSCHPEPPNDFVAKVYI